MCCARPAGRLRRHLEILQTGPRSLIRLDAGEIDTLATHPGAAVRGHLPGGVLADNKAIGKRMSFEQYIGLGHVVFRCEHQIRTCRALVHRQVGDFRKIVATHSHILIAQTVVGTDRIATLPTRSAGNSRRPCRCG